MSEAVRVERGSGVLEITLDRPKANAIDAVTSRTLGEVFTAFRDDPALRVAILTGAGERFFSAGWDLAAAEEGESYEADYGPGGFGGFPELPHLNKPVIAAVNGMAVGGGFELVMSADLVVAASHATFFLPEPAVGMIPDVGAVRLHRQLPSAVATEVLIAGRRLTASEGLRYGLVNSVVTVDELRDAAHELAGRIIQQAPLAITAILDIRRRTENLSLREGLALLRSGEIDSYHRVLHSEDAREGVRAFSEKRSPDWKGC